MTLKSRVLVLERAVLVSGIRILVLGFGGRKGMLVWAIGPRKSCTFDFGIRTLVRTDLNHYSFTMRYGCTIPPFVILKKYIPVGKLEMSIELSGCSICNINLSGEWKTWIRST